MTTIKGIIPPLAKPLSDRDTLDKEGLDRLINHVLEGGVSGIFVLGTTGEAPGLSYRLRRELITEACRIADGRVPILVGITDTSFVESVALANYATDAGASAIVLSTPYYFPVGQKELSEYIRSIVPEIPLPLMLYNIPSLTKVPFEIETLRQLADLDRIVGVKDSGGDLDYFTELISLRQQRNDWSFYMGPEHLLVPAVNAGADGGVHAAANVFPELFVNAYKAAVDNDANAIETLQRRIDSYQRVYEIGKYASKYIKATKCALSIKGICSDFMAQPFHHFKAPERERVRAILDSLD
jgi:dihydrodipicolinate synthase/N-acetylneuraminate lyase